MVPFRDFLDGLLGTYTPVVDSAGSIASGFAGVDYPYLIRAVVFCIVLFCVLRTIGGMICRM